MRRKIYKGGVDNYPFWWYGQSNRLQNFGDRTNFLTPHGAIFKGNGYYFNSANSDYMEDIYGRHLFKEGTNGVWSYLYLTNGSKSYCGNAIGSGDRLFLSVSALPVITGQIIFNPLYCPNLQKIDCPSNGILALDISRLTKLTYISCGNNLLSALDVANLVLLDTLWCFQNQISILDVSKLTKLVKLVCRQNQISVLDVSQLTLLTTLSCHSNKIPALDVSNDSLITFLDCHNNFMDQAVVDKVLCDANAWNTSGGTLDISGNTAPSQTGIDAKNDMVNNRGWTVTTD